MFETAIHNFINVVFKRWVLFKKLLNLGLCYCFILFNFRLFFDYFLFFESFMFTKSTFFCLSETNKKYK